MSRAIRNILVLNGHPDTNSKGLCHAIAEAYADGAREAGRTVRRLDVAGLRFGFVSSQAEFEKATPPEDIAAAQKQIRAADHLVVIFPLWLGDMPAVLKAFLEQTLRPGFAFTYRKRGFPNRLLQGRSARIIVTMGMPAFVYRCFFGAHGLKNLRRNILRFAGFSPVRSTLIGNVGIAAKQTIARRLMEIRQLGQRGI